VASHRLEQFPKSVKRFSDKNCGKNKHLEQERDSKIAHSALSLHQKILSDIENRIVCGDWPPGFQLPFEVELAKSYNVSRMTVNKVLTKLTERGLIERRRKLGSFVATPHSQQAILDIHDIEDEVRQLHCEYRFQLLSQCQRAAGKQDENLFEWRGNPTSCAKILPSGAKMLLELSCLHFAQDIPFCHEARSINLGVVPQAMTQDFTTISPGKWLRQQVPWSSAEHKIHAVAASDSLAKKLQIATGAPCLVVQRRTWNAQGVVTFVRFTYPAEKHAVIARFTPATPGGYSERT